MFLFSRKAVGSYVFVKNVKNPGAQEQAGVRLISKQPAMLPTIVLKLKKLSAILILMKTILILPASLLSLQARTQLECVVMVMTSLKRSFIHMMLTLPKNSAKRSLHLRSSNKCLCETTKKKLIPSAGCHFPPEGH